MQPIFSFFIQLANCSVKKKQKEKYQFCESNLKISLFKICKLKIISNEKTIFKLSYMHTYLCKKSENTY